MTLALEQVPALRSAEPGRLGADVLDVFKALLWRRAHRLRQALRNPHYLFAAFGLAAFAVFVVSQIPVHPRHARDTHIAGTIFLLEIGMTPFFTRRAGFHIAAPRADAQWVLTASGGANAYLLERTGFRVLMSLVFAGIGLGGAAAGGAGRSAGAAVVLLCVASLNSLTHGALGTVAFKVLRDREPSRAWQVGLFSAWIGLMGACAGNLGGLGVIVTPFGQMIEGRATPSTLIGLAGLTVFSGVMLAVEQHGAAWFIEPMADAGLLREQELPAERKRRRGRAPRSWEGLARMRGGAAVVWMGLAVERRFFRPRLIQNLVLVAIAVVAVVTAPRQPLWPLVAPFFAAYQVRLAVTPNPSRDEYFGRAPFPLWRVVTGYLFRPSLVFGTIAVTVWLPVAFIWTRGAPAYLLIGLAELLFFLVLVASNTFAQVLAARNPSLSFLIRIPFPIVLALGCLGSYRAGDGGGAVGVALSVALGLGVLSVCRGLIKLIRTT